MKYSQIIAALNLTHIGIDVLGAIYVFYVFCDKILVYLFGEDFLLLHRNSIKSVHNGDCIF